MRMLMGPIMVRTALQPAEGGNQAAMESDETSWAGIEPIVTLHHFTNPLWLSDGGGWLRRSVVVVTT